MAENLIEQEKKPIKPTLREMEIGETTSFPAIQCAAVKVACSELGFQLGRKFKTTNNRETRTVDVTRIE